MMNNIHFMSDIACCVYLYNGNAETAKKKKKMLTQERSERARVSAEMEKSRRKNIEGANKKENRTREEKNETL